MAEQTTALIDGLPTAAADDLPHWIVDSLEDGIYFTDLDRRIRYWAGGAERITGYAADEVLGHSCFANVLDHVDADGTSLCLSRCPLDATLRDGKRRTTQMYLRHRDGHRVPVRVRTSPVLDQTGTIIGVTEVFTDETPVPSPYLDVAELRRLAFGDVLTGLPNRTHAERALAGRLASLERRGWPFGLLIADVDTFKAVNDLHGHLAGDAVLQVVARTLAGASRPEDLVARWGGDEFVVIVAAADGTDLRAAAQRMRALVARSRPEVDGGHLRISVSVGGAVARRGDTPEGLFERADRALYAAKRAGRNGVGVFDGDDLYLAPASGHRGHDDDGSEPVGARPQAARPKSADDDFRRAGRTWP